MPLFRSLMSVSFATALFGVSVSNVWADDDGRRSEHSTQSVRPASNEKSESSSDEEVKATSESDSTSESGGSDPISDNQKVFTGVAPSISGTTASSGSPNSAAVQQLQKSLTLDPDQAKNAIKQGMAATMPLLLTYLKHNYPGELVDVQLHNAGPGYVYEVRYLSNVIFLRTVYLDAITLQRK